MATERLPDLNALATELAHLQHRRRELTRQHEKLCERMLEFPNEFGLAWSRSLAAEIEGLVARASDLEAKLFLQRPR